MSEQIAGFASEIFDRSKAGNYGKIGIHNAV